MSYWQVLVPEGTDNYIVDPSFEFNTTYAGGVSTAEWGGSTGAFGSSTGGAYWSVILGTSGNVVLVSSQACFGSKSVLMNAGASTVGASLYQSVTMTTAQWTLSCHVQKSTGGAPTSTDIQAIIGTSTGAFDSITAISTGWYRAVVTVTGTAGAANVGVLACTGSANFYVDAVQFE